MLDPGVETLTEDYLKAQIAAHWPHDLAAALRYAGLLARLHTADGPFPHAPDTVAALAETVAQADQPVPPALRDDDALAQAVADQLKRQVDAYRWGDITQARRYVAGLTRLADARNDARQRALALMADGDTQVAAGGNAQSAWDTLTAAAQLYLQAGDLLGWARTCTGRVGICVGLNRVDEAMTDAERAQVIFAHENAFDLLIRLANNRMATYNNLGQYQDTVAVYTSVAEAVSRLGDDARPRLGIFYNNVGVARLYLGDFHTALDFFEQARAIFDALNNTSGGLIVTQNIAYIEQAHGHYQRALHLLHTIIAQMEGDHSIHVQRVKSDLVECYLKLNRYAEARELAVQMLPEFHDLGETYAADRAQTLLHLATAEASLSRFDPARDTLQQARDLFAALGAESWLAASTLLQSRIALQHGDPAQADALAQEAAGHFERQGQQVSVIRARAVQARALLDLGNYAAALRIAQGIGAAVRRRRMPELQYQAHVLLGRIAEQTQDARRAVRHYRAAAATVQRVQSRLTITLRPGFLEDKTEVTHALIRLALDAGRVRQAFDTLERAKSQTLSGYLANRAQLYWRRDSPETAALLDRLDRLRARHHWLYRLAYEYAMLEADEPTLAPDLAAEELAACEQDIRRLTEQLYLHSADASGFNAASCPDLEQIQARLGDEDLLLAYYDDGRQFTVFAVTRQHIQVHRDIARSTDVSQAMQKMTFNVSCALASTPESPVMRTLTGVFRRLGAQLYDALLRPVGSRLEHCGRVFVVPYGQLHYVPFHALHDGQQYLIEGREVVVLPSAGLITHTPPRRPAGARILAHSHQGRLPQTQHEAALVGNRLSGEVVLEGEAGRERLAADPVQVLHVTAHGKHRMDHPELSYLELADGQLFTDDLLQYDLSYELVTLSACETGQAAVTAGEDLIGLGRGVLVAGAGALVASLWSVHDPSAPGLMDSFYAALLAGQSKAGALRHAQCAALAGAPTGAPERHPAFWGAFQLIGNPDPLSPRPPEN